MKKPIFLSFIFLSLSYLSVHGQSQNVLFDTLIYENLENGLDADIKTPSGNDQKWVLYDEDGFPQRCAKEEDTYGYYVTFDWGLDTTNKIIASCSFTNNAGFNSCGNKQNKNWLILPPQFISGNSIELGWKSAPYHGPMWMDGYKVLVSTSGNLPESFTDTLFVAAETLNSPDPPLFSGGLLVQNYTFSQGYIHANSFTESAYFDQRVLEGLPIFQGILEPHTVDLSDYKDQLIYVAFLHDSYCNHSVEFDDIFIRESELSSINKVESEITTMGIFPNPSVLKSNLTLSLSRKSVLTLRFFDSKGILIQQKNIGEKPAGDYQIPLETSSLTNGIYYVQVQTNTGIQSQKLFVQH